MEAEGPRGPRDKEPRLVPGRSPGRSAEQAEDRELVRRAQGGDEAAFGLLVERHGDRAYALALRILKSTSDAEEVAQDALVRAWRSLSRFRGDSAFSSWLYRIVARQAFDRAAVLKSRRNREAGGEGIEEMPAEAAGPDAEARERSVRLERLVAGLADVPRTVVTLYYYQDRSVAEVARILSMPENTVKTHLSRARAALRTGWTREDDPEASSAAPGEDEETR
jgi:RNA polymerase sigma-70 factor (ECF subfamily)